MYFLLINRIMTPQLGPADVSVLLLPSTGVKGLIEGLLGQDRGVRGGCEDGVEASSYRPLYLARMNVAISSTQKAVACFNSLQPRRRTMSGVGS